ncbi:MAG TPA: hypothetical protein VMN81_05695 [Vicinamibacterales bacterium]|nr:hypothetical protein [Vicinamibacterales bacterium]
MEHGQRAAEVSAGWSVGPSSTGFELTAGASLDGRTEAGITFGRYTFDDGGKSRFSEYAPYVRVFPIKEQNGAPVSISVNAQLFFDDYPADDDPGRYVQVGTTVYKELKIAGALSLHPYVGFAFVAESYAFGGGAAENAQYLTRELGLHFATDTSRAWFVRVTLAEQSFRRETYRGARLGVIRRF